MTDAQENRNDQSETPTVTRVGDATGDDHNRDKPGDGRNSWRDIRPVGLLSWIYDQII